MQFHIVIPCLKIKTSKLNLNQLKNVTKKSKTFFSKIPVHKTHISSSRNPLLINKTHKLVNHVSYEKYGIHKFSLFKISIVSSSTFLSSNSKALKKMIIISKLISKVNQVCIKYASSHKSFDHFFV